MRRVIGLVLMLVLSGCALGRSSVESWRDASGRPHTRYRRSAVGLGSLDGEGTTPLDMAYADAVMRSVDRADRVLDYCLRQGLPAYYCQYGGGWPVMPYAYNEMGMLETGRYLNVTGEPELIFIPPTPAIETSLPPRGGGRTHDPSDGSGGSDDSGYDSSRCKPDQRQVEFDRLTTDVRRLLAARPLDKRALNALFDDGKSRFDDALKACRGNAEVLGRFRSLRNEFKNLRDKFDDEVKK